MNLFEPMSSLDSNAKKKARVLVVDDHPIVRHALADLVNRQPDLMCCGEADDITSIRTAIERERPDLILLDLRLGHEDGLESIKALKAQDESLCILVVSACDEMLYAERVVRAGAAGYIMKEEKPSELLAAMRSVLNGQLYVSRKIAMTVFQKSIETAPRPAGGGIESLTDRELQVFQLLGADLSTRQIASRLSLSVKTIETYRENIKHKLGLRDASDLVRSATEWVKHQRLPRNSSSE